MNNDENYFLRILFRLEVYQNDGYSFQTFFERIMKCDNKHFEVVKPHGNVGDRKNDGFDKKNGKYYQVYAPENSTVKLYDSINKIQSDFKGLYDYWKIGNKFDINEYYFVLNDKYKGAFPELYVELNKIEQKYKIRTFLMCAPQLEDIFLSLSIDDKISIVGIPPDSSNFEIIDYDIVDDIISHLLKNSIMISPESIPNNPSFENKIKFNKLSSGVSGLLTTGSFQVSKVKEYFDQNGSYPYEQIRTRLSNLYKEGQNLYNNNENKDDLIFFYILNKAKPGCSPQYQNNIIVLMAYFFEYCDIYETPVA